MHLSVPQSGPSPRHYPPHRILPNSMQVERRKYESIEGDLYAPVMGRRFDVVAAHPLGAFDGDAMVFRDGGDSGEAIIRRIIEGIPHLRNGGAPSSSRSGRYDRSRTSGAFAVARRTWEGLRLILGVEKMLTIEEVSALSANFTSMRPRKRLGSLPPPQAWPDRFIYGPCSSGDGERLRSRLPCACRRAP